MPSNPTSRPEKPQDSAPESATPPHQNKYPSIFHLLEANPQAELISIKLADGTILYSKDQTKNVASERALKFITHKFWYAFGCLSKRPAMLLAILAIIVVVGLGGYLGFGAYRESQYPCEYRSTASLTNQFPTLKRIEERQIAFLDVRETTEKILEAKLDLGVKRGRISEEKAFELLTLASTITFEGLDRIHQEFMTECNRLTQSR